MKKKVWFTVEVEPISAGNFGWASMSGVYYTERELESLSKDIVSQIKKHVDRVGSTRVVWEYEDE